MDENKKNSKDSVEGITKVYQEMPGIAKADIAKAQKIPGITQIYQEMPGITKVQETPEITKVYQKIPQDVPIFRKMYQERPLTKGIILDNRYLIEEQLGAGGTGRVFKALDIEEGRKARAIKWVIANDESARNRFQREYEFLKRTNHPNLVKAFDYFEKGNYLFMVLEYVEGLSMGNILEKEEKSVFSLIEQLAIANKIARVLEMLHIENIIHRDVKPDNIMINQPTGDVKLLDLGTLKDLKDLSEEGKMTKAGETVGTAAYMSPEQIEGRELEATSDVFSLGVSLYQFFLWQKQSPFFTPTTYSTILKVAEENPPTIYEIIRQKNTENLFQIEDAAYISLSQLIAKAMNKNPQERWPHAGIVADRCEEIYKEFIKIDWYRKSIRNVNLSILAAKIDRNAARRSLQGEKKEKKEMSFQKGIIKKKKNSKQKPFGKLLLVFSIFFFASLVAISFLSSRPSRPEKQINTEQVQDKSEEMNKAALLWEKMENFQNSPDEFWKNFHIFENLSSEFFIYAMKGRTYQSAALFQAVCDLQLSHFQKAFEILEKENGTSGLFLYFRGKTRCCMGDWHRGKGDISKAFALLPDAGLQNGTLFYYLGSPNFGQVYYHRLKVQKLPATMERNLFLCLSGLIFDRYIPNVMPSPSELWTELAEKYRLPGAYLYLANLSFKQNDLDGVKQYLKKATDLGVPSYVTLYYQADWEPSSAIEALKKVILARPDFVEAYFKAGFRSLEIKSDQQAFFYFQKMVELQGETIENQLYLGESLIRLGKIKESVKTLEKGISLYQQSPSSLYRELAIKLYLNYAQVMEAIGKDKEAVQNYEIAIDIYHGSTYPIEMLLSHYYQRGQYYKALEAALCHRITIISEKFLGKISIDELKTKAMQENERLMESEKDTVKLAQLYTDRSYIYMAMGRMDKSYEAVKKSIQIYPTAEGYFTQGQLYFLQNKYAEALQNYNKSLELKPDYCDSLSGRIYCYASYPFEVNVEFFHFVCKDLDTIFLRVPELQYRDSFAHYSNLALSKCRKIKDPKITRKLLEYFEKLAAFSKSHGRYNIAWTYYECAGIYEEAKDYDKALSMYQKAFLLHPLYVYTYAYRGTFFKKRGEKEKALADYYFALFLLQGAKLPSNDVNIPQEIQELEKNDKK